MRSMKLITSAQNEQLKHLFRLLTQAKARRESGETVLEGVHLLQTYLQSGGTPKQVYLPEKKQQHPEIQEITAQLDEGLITWVGNEALSKITSLTDADDVMTWIDIPQQAGLPSDGDCVVLERVQDPGNAGTILRSAAAAGVKQIVCGNDSVDIWSPKVLRAGMGAHFLLSIFSRVELSAWMERYQHQIWATALGGRNIGLYEMDLSKPCAWVFGNEGSGVSETVKEKADACVKIPMLGQTESLNVAMAATVCLFEQMRQRIHAQAV